MVQLNASTLSSVKMARGVAPKTERVIQFGEGGFLRAFCDWMIDMANEKAGMDAGVVIVQPIERGMVSMLNEQDGLYTLILRGQVDGKPSKDERIIQSVKRGLSPYEDFEGYLALAHNPDMRIIISNTTEAGIVYTGKDSFDDKPQASYPGKLTRLLYERFTALGGKKGTGFILLPCELIDYNGRNLEECCMKTAEQWGLSEEFKTWLKTENVFCSTLVDRIVTGYPRGEAESLYEEFGYRDNMLDTAEPFGLWVIEGPAWIENELPFKKAGCNVVFTQDVSPYKLRKVRMLNGAHTSMVLGAYLAGHEIVGDCMADDTMRSYMSQALFNPVQPSPAALHRAQQPEQIPRARAADHQGVCEAQARSAEDPDLLHGGVHRLLLRQEEGRRLFRGRSRRGQRVSDCRRSVCTRLLCGHDGQAGCGNRARRADQRRFLGQRPDRRASGL